MCDRFRIIRWAGLWEGRSWPAAGDGNERGAPPTVLYRFIQIHTKLFAQKLPGWLGWFSCGKMYWLVIGWLIWLAKRAKRAKFGWHSEPGRAKRAKFGSPICQPRKASQANFLEMPTPACHVQQSVKYSLGRKTEFFIWITRILYVNLPPLQLMSPFWY